MNLLNNINMAMTMMIIMIQYSSIIVTIFYINGNK